MERIFFFLYRYRTFLTFVVLECICAWMIIQTNDYHSTRFYNSSNGLVMSINSLSYRMNQYFSLQDVNNQLSEQNTRLREALARQNQRLYAIAAQSAGGPAATERFEFVGARVLNNSVDRSTNYISIDKGTNAGLMPGMAVIGADGIVGKVRSCSSHFSLVTSVLNVNVMVSAALKRTGHFGTVQWSGRDPRYVDFKYIPPYVHPQQGDTVVTSGYNSVFPSDVMIGTIDQVHLTEGALSYDISVKLSQDFRKLSYVIVVKSELKKELDSLEQQLPTIKQ